MLKFEYTAKFFLYILWNLKVDVFKMVCDFFFFFWPPSDSIWNSLEHCSLTDQRHLLVSGGTAHSELTLPKLCILSRLTTCSKNKFN